MKLDHADASEGTGRPNTAQTPVILGLTQRPYTAKRGNAETKASFSYSQALAAKYPFWQELLSKPESQRPDMALVRMDPRSP